MRGRLGAIVLGVGMLTTPAAAEEALVAGFSVSGSAVTVTD